MIKHAVSWRCPIRRAITITGGTRVVLRRDGAALWPSSVQAGEWWSESPVGWLRASLCPSPYRAACLALQPHNNTAHALHLDLCPRRAPAPVRRVATASRASRLTAVPGSAPLKRLVHCRPPSPSVPCSASQHEAGSPVSCLLSRI